MSAFDPVDNAAELERRYREAARKCQDSIDRFDDAADVCKELRAAGGEPYAKSALAFADAYIEMHAALDAAEAAYVALRAPYPPLVPARGAK